MLTYKYPTSGSQGLNFFPWTPIWSGSSLSVRGPKLAMVVLFHRSYGFGQYDLHWKVKQSLFSIISQKILSIYLWKVFPWKVISEGWEANDGHLHVVWVQVPLV